jgi:hypothetical protein
MADFQPPHLAEDAFGRLDSRAIAGASVSRGAPQVSWRHARTTAVMGRFFGLPDGASGTETVTLSGGLHAVTISVTPADGIAQSTEKDALWKGGEAIAFDATGGVIPPAHAELVAPAQPGFSDLVAPPTGPLVLSPSNDTPLSWSAGTPATRFVVEVSVVPNSDAGISKTTRVAVCQYDAAGGKGTLPAAALAALGSEKVLVQAFGGSSARLQIGNATVIAELVSTPVTSGGKLWAASVAVLEPK